MSEWWTYRLADFLLFSARTYYRLFELYNAEVWPGHLIAFALWLALCIAALRGGAAAARAACVMLAGCWLWVAWAFHWQRFTSINWAATWFASAFAIEAALWLGSGATGAGWRLRSWRGRRGGVGLGLLVFAWLVQPWIGVLLGRPWRQAEVFGLAPDPTVVATLGLLLLLQRVDETGAAPSARRLARLLWPIPLLWCIASGATLWAMHASDAWLLPCAAVLACCIAWRDRPLRG